MSRNKHPEVTVERILGAAERLFLGKGYDDTTIQDIVDELGGLTKGAVYHHFNGKEEILEAVSSRMFSRADPFGKVMCREDLDALGKLREAVRLSFADAACSELAAQTVQANRNPRMLVKMLLSGRDVLTPRFAELIELGLEDGSISTPYGPELAELLPLLSSLWLLPAVYPTSEEELRRKFSFIADMLDRMGLPIFTEDFKGLVESYIEKRAAKCRADCG